MIDLLTMVNWLYTTFLIVQLKYFMFSLLQLSACAGARTTSVARLSPCYLENRRVEGVSERLGFNKKSQLEIRTYGRSNRDQYLKKGKV